MPDHETLALPLRKKFGHRHAREVDDAAYSVGRQQQRHDVFAVLKLEPVAFKQNPQEDLQAHGGRQREVGHHALQVRLFLAHDVTGPFQEQGRVQQTLFVHGPRIDLQHRALLPGHAAHVDHVTGQAGDVAHGAPRSDEA